MNNKKRSLRVAWQSNAGFTPSGYGQQTHDIEKMFVKSGWDKDNFCMINMFGQGGGKFIDSLGIWNYPNMNHTYGSDAMLHHGNNFKADIIITLQDIWPLNPQDLAQIGRFIPWVPIDYDPAPTGLVGNLRFANRIISMSRFGEKQLKEKGFSSFYIPHHVDTSIFFPMDKKRRKMETGINPDIFLFGMVAANKDLMPRKSFQQVLEAFAKFRSIHPNSMLYIHTNPDQPGGFPIRQYVDFLGISANVSYPDTYKWQFDTSKEEMNLIYNTFDAYLSPSSSEGFCIPVIEAQACGVPVIVNNWTSMPELIQDKKTGLITDIGCKHFFPIGSYMAWPSTQSIYEKMEILFGSNREEMGKAAKKWIDQEYSLDKVWKDRWLVFLDKIEKEIYPQLTTPSVTV